MKQMIKSWGNGKQLHFWKFWTGAQIIGKFPFLHAFLIYHGAAKCWQLETWGSIFSMWNADGSDLATLPEAIQEVFHHA
jgi:hypothetical protein